VGKPDVRNFRGGTGNRAMADLYRHEAGNGRYGLREPKATAPVLYSTISIELWAMERRLRIMTRWVKSTAKYARR
jgi:hypothetical protein